MRQKIDTILASASPRRLELLKLLHIHPEVVIPKVREVPVQGEFPEAFALRIAREKGLSILNERNREKLIISSDTIVLVDGRMIGKPVDSVSAGEMLRLLSGKIHKVITAVSLLYEGRENAETSVTDVEFKPLTDSEISDYMKSEHYLDKAGAYAIQGRASIFVKRINGCFFNVMGFPLNLFYSMLNALNIDLKDISAAGQ